MKNKIIITALIIAFNALINANYGQTTVYCLVTSDGTRTVDSCSGDVICSGCTSGSIGSIGKEDRGVCGVDYLNYYVKFNLNPIPNNATITSAYIVLQRSTSASLSSESVKGVAYRIANDWSESTLVNSVPNYSSDGNSSYTTSGTSSTWSFDVKNTVVKWIENETDNYGVVLYTLSTTTTDNVWYFYTRFASTSDRPELKVTYTCPNPDIPSNPISNSPQCESSGVTLTHSSSPPPGVTWYWQTSSNGTSTSQGSGSTKTVYSSGTYYIRAKRDDCDDIWSSDSGFIDVTVNSEPSTTLVSGGGSTCDCLTLTASGGSGGTIYYQGTNSNGTSTSNPSLTETVCSSNTYYFRSRSSAGCWGEQGSADVSIKTESTPPTNAFASLETICLNESTTLSQSDGDLGTGASWKWYSGSCGGAIVGSGGSISVSPESSTTYYVRAEGDCNPTGTDCANITITVVDPPIQPVPIEGEVSPCLSSNYTYTIDPVFGVTYTWDFTGSGTLDQNGSSCSLTPTSNGTLSVLASKDNCESTASTLPLTVTTKPDPPESVVGNFNICTNSEEIYEIDPVPGATSYRWKLPSGWECIGSNCNSSSTITTKVGTDGGNIRVFAVNSCGESEYVQPVTIKGIAPDQPGPIMEEEGSPCKDSLRTYSVNEDSNILSYEWTLPDGWSGNSNSNLIEATVGSGNGEVCVVPINNCGEGQPICLNVIASTIPDDPGLIEGDKTPCSGSTQTYVIPHILNATVYDWNFSGEGSLNENNTSSCTLVPTTSGILEVTLSNKCGPSANTSTIAIAVAELPDTPSGVIAQDDMVKNEITITWEPVNGIDTYIIYRDGDSLTTRTSNRAYYTDNDAPCEVVTYEVYSFNGCLSEVAGSDTGYRLNCIPTGISEKRGFRVYPNPAEDKLTVELGESSPSFSKVTIHNSHGQVVLSSTINDWKIYNIDISRLTRGIYFIRLAGNDASVMKKFMIKN
ncbi:MAG: DNRLRE domain-containing protein [Cyclobacteriaceae bacterium]